LYPLIFNFHQLIHLEIWSDDERVRRFYISEYGHHMVQNKQPHQAMVKLYLNSDRHPVTEKSFRHRHKWLAHWRHEISFKQDHIEILASGNAFAIPMIHHMLVHPGLRYLSAQLGVLMLHASAVVHNGKSIVFASKPGIGKTTINAILLSDKQTFWQPHADDYVFLTPQPQSLSYVTRHHLYQPIIKWVPEIAATLSAWQKLKIKGFSLLRRLSHNTLKWPLRMETAHAWPHLETCDQAVASGLVLLHNSQEKEAAFQPLQNSDVVLENLFTLNFSEVQHFIRFVIESHPHFVPRIGEWQKQEKTLLKSILHTIPLFDLQLPEKPIPSQSFRKEFSVLVSSMLDNNH
jgi:hypothetical protein